MTAVVKIHLTAAVSCCLEMALWSTLWIVDEVSLAAIGSASRNKKLMNFLACGSGRLVVSKICGTRLMCGYLSNLVFSALLVIFPAFVLTAETRDGLQEKGETTETSKYVSDPLRLKKRSIRACLVCLLTTRVRADFDPIVRLNDIRKASRHCCMPAVNTSSISAAITMMRQTHTQTDTHRQTHTQTDTHRQTHTHRHAQHARTCPNCRTVGVQGTLFQCMA